jgi:hypothetical protein
MSITNLMKILELIQNLFCATNSDGRTYKYVTILFWAALSTLLLHFCVYFLFSILFCTRWNGSFMARFEIIAIYVCQYDRLLRWCSIHFHSPPFKSPSGCKRQEGATVYCTAIHTSCNEVVCNLSPQRGENGNATESCSEDTQIESSSCLSWLVRVHGLHKRSYLSVHPSVCLQV